MSIVMGTSHLIHGFDQYSFILFNTPTEYKTKQHRTNSIEAFCGNNS